MLTQSSPKSSRKAETTALTFESSAYKLAESACVRIKKKFVVI